MPTRTRDLTDQINGVRTAFSTLDVFVPETLEVYLNGVRQRRNVFFTETGANTFRANETPLPGDVLSVQFETELTSDGGGVSIPLVLPSGTDPARP